MSPIFLVLRSRSTWIFSKLEGMIPVEMLGYVGIPRRGSSPPYRLTLAPYSFLWLELQRKSEPVEASAVFTEQFPFNVTAGWESLVEGRSRERLETLDLPEFLPKQRWFGGKSRHIEATKIADSAELEASQSALALVEVRFDNGLSDTYQLPLAMAFADAGDELQRAAPNAGIAAIVSKEVSGLLHDGVFDDKACQELFSLIENARTIDAHHGQIKGLRGKAFQEILGLTKTPLQVRRGSAEQSNTSILFGDAFILKLFRRLEPGVNPDCEIGQYLNDRTNFNGIPPFAGLIEYAPSAGAETTTLAMLQGIVANEGDGWKWTVEELDRYYETCAAVTFPENASDELGDPVDLSERPTSQLARDHVGIYLDFAAILGRRTAELHLALASPTDNLAFAPEPMTPDDLLAQLADTRRQASGVFDVLKERVSYLPDEVVEIAASTLSRRRRIFWIIWRI